MNRFHVCKKVKSFLLVALSVAILVCSVPSFSIRSQALETAVAVELGRYAIQYYMSFATYLMSKGYKAPRIASDDSDYLVSNVGASGEAFEVVSSFLNKVKAINAPMYAKIYQALTNSISTGKLVISEEVDSWIESYFESLTIDSSMVVGSSTQTFDPIEAETRLTFSYLAQSIADPTNSSAHSLYFYCDYECLPVLSYDFDSNGILSRVQIFMIPTEPLTREQAANCIHSSFTNPDTDYVFFNVAANSLGVTNDGAGFVPIVSINFITDTQAYNSFNFPNILTGVSLAYATVVSILNYFRQHGYYEDELEYTSQQAYDTSSTDILSNASQIDATTGAVSGGLTIFLPAYQTLVNTLQDFYDGTISWISAIKALGLSSVSDSATTQEKEEALSNVAVPDATYSWLTDTAWGSETIANSVTDELATTQTQEKSIAEDLAEQYSNSPEGPQEDDEKKGGLAMLIATALLYLGLWNDPSTDPTDPDSGGIAGDPDDQETVPWLVDTLTAIPVASSILGDFFDAAGGTNGYGFIYTVGISFVLFSVIIGAGHFFGALGSEIQARSQENDIKADHEYNKQEAYKAYREGLISKRELYSMTRK